MAKELTPELKQRILVLRGVDNESYRTIADIITKEFPGSYSHMWVKNICETYEKELANAIENSPPVKNEFVKNIKIEQQELAKIRHELWDCVDEAERVPDKVRALKVLIDTSSSQISTLDKIYQGVTQQQKTKETTPMDIEEMINKISLDVLKKIIKEKEKEEMEQYA